MNGPTKRPINPLGGLARQREAERLLRQQEHPLLRPLGARQPRRKP